MPKKVKMNAFTGMNNIKDSEGLFVKKGGVVEPRIILNADVSEAGRIVKRDGFTKIIPLTDGHSEWAGATCHLVMDGTVLKRVNGTTATAIEDVGGLVTPMYYAEVGARVYLSNKYFNGIFDPFTDTVSPWGIMLPTGPVLSSASGSLSAGTYHACFTQKSGAFISGNGPISRIVLAREGGISISNRPSGAVVWCTDPDGDIFYRIGETGHVVDVPTVEPLPSLFCSPPPFMEHITHAFGRMWGARGNKLYYAESFHPDWWKLGVCFFEFATDITLIAKTWSGLFVGCEDRTYFEMGTQPEKMKQIDVGAGAIAGTLSYANDIIELGDTISPPEKKHASVPVWVSQEGFVAGNPAGRLFSLSQQKVKFAPGDVGASLYRKKDGSFQMLASFAPGGVQSGLGMSDEATLTVMRNGVVI
jgi:hypothetical protein